MSRTRKDSRHASTILELVKRDDGTFDLFVSRKLEQGQIAEEWLPEQLCARFGFCCDEYDSIMEEVSRDGKATRVMSG